MSISETSAKGEGASYSAAARLSSLPVVVRTQKLWCALLGVLFAFDVVDIYSFSYAAPQLSHEWHLSLGDTAMATSVAFLGNFAGAIVGGRLSDRIGRKKTIILAVMIFSTFSLLTIAASSLPLLIVMRFFTGFGIQAMTGVLIVYVAEMFPQCARGRYQSMLLAIGLLGVPLTAWVARLVISLGPGMWRWIFVFGSLGAVAGVVAIYALPESVRWQSSMGYAAQANETVAILESEAEAKIGKPLPTPSEPANVLSGRLSELRHGTNARNLMVTCVGAILVGVGFFGVNAYIPTLLVQRGASTSQSLMLASLFSLAAVPGALLAWPIVDRIERKHALFGTTIAVGTVMVVFGLANQSILVLVSGFLLSMLLQTQTVFLYSYLPAVFPTHLRGAGAGTATGLGRVAVFGSGFVIAPLFTTVGFGGYFITMAAVIILGGAVFGVFGISTTQRALVEVADRPAGLGRDD